jgi:pimeloyl-ACP methyl ester carboxylesterase
VASLFPPDGHPSRLAYVEAVVSAFPRADQVLVEGSAQQLGQREDGSWAWPDSADLAVLGGDPAEPASEEDEALRAAVNCPVLIVRAQQSELFVGDAYITVAQRYRRGTAAELAGSGHMIQWENVPALTNMINEFITVTSVP